MTNEEMAQAIEQVLRDYSIYSNDAAKLAKIAAALRAVEWKPIDPNNDDYDGPEDSFLVGRKLPDGRPQWDIEGRQDVAYRRGYRFMAPLLEPPEGV